MSGASAHDDTELGEESQPESVESSADTQNMPDSSLADDGEDLRALLEEARLQVTEYEGKYRRAMADYVNLERRTALDIERRKNQATDNLLREFLEIYDDFVRARDSYGTAGVDITGLDSLLKNAEAMLGRQGVTPVSSMGELFDPKIHEALSTKPDSSLEDQTVVQEIRKGYIISDRVLRTALVVVSTKEK